MFQILVLLYFTAGFYTIESARILAVFPTPSISHQLVFRVLTEELAKRGHEVVVITTDPAFPNEQAPKNLTEIDVHDISYNFLKHVMAKVWSEFEYGKEEPWTTLEKEMQKFLTVIEVQIKSKPVQDLIKKKSEFDILLIEAFMKPALVFSHIFNAPVILVSSFGATLENLDNFGVSTHPMLYPAPFRQRLYNLSLWEKLREYYYYALYMFTRESDEHFYDELLQGIFGPNLPTITELTKNVDMLFLNVHPIWMGNQPVPPGIVFMGGLHQKPVKELPQELKSYLDSSKNGVVYVSFGTNVHSMLFSAERLAVITEALSELPYDILFKWNDDKLPGRTDNIKISKWLPQSDLLRHPKIKAFVTQGGLQSTDEAITAGVPLICIPMLGDQWYNAEKYVHFKIGHKLDLMSLTKTKLKTAIETVISDKSYRKNIVKLRERMNDQPQTPLDRAVWWTEYLLRHGGAQHLQSPAANMSLAEFYDLELIIIVLTSLLIILVIGLFIGLFLWRYIIQQCVGFSDKIKKS